MAGHVIRNTGPVRSSSPRAVSLAFTAREVSPEKELIAYYSIFDRGTGFIHNNNNLDNNKIVTEKQTRRSGRPFPLIESLLRINRAREGNISEIYSCVVLVKLSRGNASHINRVANGCAPRSRVTPIPRCSDFSALHRGQMGR